MKSLMIVFLIVLICGCKEKQVTKQVSQNKQHPRTDSVKQLSIEMIGELRFRKSYALRETMPSYCYDQDADSLLLKRFKGLGFLNNNYELLEKKLSQFKLFNIEKPDTAFNVTDPFNKKLTCLIKKADSTFKYEIFVADSLQGTLLRIDNEFIIPGLQFNTHDIVVGGFEEIIILEAYYIINGDNFDFFIYEIKYN